MKTKKIAVGQLRAAPLPDTYNAEARTLDVVFSTEAPVKRYDWWEGEMYDEVLSFDPAAVRIERFTGGASPVLFNHNANMQLGTVERAWIEDGKGYATLRLTQAEDVKDYVQRVSEGILRSISIGYKILSYEEKREEDKLTRTATDWEPYEISFVTIPADREAKVRSEAAPQYSEAKVKIISQPAAERSEKSQIMSDEKNGVRSEETKAPELNVEQLRAEAAKNERERIGLIEKQLQHAGLSDAEFRSELIEQGLTPEKAAVRILEKLEKAQPKQNAAVSGQAVEDKRRELVQNAVLHRLNATEDGKKIELNNEARAYRNMSLIELARDLGRQQGLSSRNWSKDEAASFLMGKMDTRTLATSDFPSILRDVASKRLIEMYEQFDNTWRSLAMQMSAADFKTQYAERFESNIRFEEVVEGGTYTEANMVEGEEAVRAKTYGKKVSLTRKLIINDDLGAFDRRLQMLARGAAQTEGDIVWELLLNNSNYQGSAVFSAGRNNLVSPGTAISVSSLSAGRAAMMNSVNEAGDDIMVVPSMLFVAPENLTLAEQVLNSNTDYSKDNPAVINPFSGRIQIMVERRLGKSAYSLTDGTGLQWLLAAAPTAGVAAIATTTVGDGGLFTESRVNWNNDALETKARFDFGAALWNYRSVYFNEGA